MSTCTKERSGTESPRPLTPPTTDDEAVDTPAVSRLALPSPHFTFAFASDSRSDLRIVSFICEDGDTLGKPIAFLQHELEDFPSEEEWYRNMDRDTVMIAAPDWTPPQTPLDDGFDITLPDPSAFLEAPSLQPPQSSTASAFAFFQNAFLNRPERPESDTSSVSSGSCYSRLSGESLGSSEESYHDCEQARGTVNSSTLGGLDVYMRTGSIIHWTHHPQYAARIERSSQPSFLRELNAWDDDRFDFDPVTPFARDWQTKVDIEKPGAEDQGVVEVARSERTPSEPAGERVEEPVANTHNSTPGVSSSPRKRLRKPRPPQPSPSDRPFIEPKPKTSPLPGLKVFAHLVPIICCPNRKPIDSPPTSPSFRILLPRPRLDALLQYGSKAHSENVTAPKSRRAGGKEPWVWVDITRRSATSSQR